MATTARRAQQQNDSDTGAARAWQRLAWYSSNRLVLDSLIKFCNAGRGSHSPLQSCLLSNPSLSPHSDMVVRRKPYSICFQSAYLNETLDET